MRVSIIKGNIYYINSVQHSASPGDVVDVPDYIARGMIEAGYGREHCSKPLASPTNKMASPDVTKADDEPESCDLTALPKIGKGNAKAINKLGIKTYEGLLAYIQTEAGREAIIALPRVTADDISDIEAALLDLVTGNG